MAKRPDINPTAEFDLLERIGKGQFGEVWKAQHKKSKQLLAIKKILPGAALADITKEIAIMKKCVSPHVVRYYGNYYHEGMLWIIMEYCSLGSLNDIMIVTGKTLSEVQIATVCKAMLEALHFMQKQAKIHRDIKPHNVLINKYGAAKLCDFGISSDLEAGALRKTVIGTPYYLAPEVLKDQGYDFKADIWAVGISAIEMAEKDPPYADLHPMRVLYVLANNPAPKLTHEEHWSPEFNSFVRACLELSPEKRPSAKELLDHPFLKKENVRKLDPLIQAAIDAIDKYGGLEKALEAMRPKPEEEGETEQDAVDKDMNEDMLAGSGALLTLDSPGSTLGTSLAIGSSDDEDESDFFDDFESGSGDDDSDSDSASESIDIDDILGDFGESDSLPKTPRKVKDKDSKKSEATPSSSASTSTSKLKPTTSTATPKSGGLGLDIAGILDAKKPDPGNPNQTPRTRREESNKLKIQMGANGQIFGAPAPSTTARTHREDPKEAPSASSAAVPSIAASLSSSIIAPEIDWDGLEADARAEAEAEKRYQQSRVAGSEAAVAPDSSTAATSSTTIEKNAKAIDWSKAMAQMQEEIKAAATKRSHHRTTTGSSSSGNYEDLLAELDTIGKQGGRQTPERERHEVLLLAQKAFEREFPLAMPFGMKGDWVGRFDGPNPFRNNPQFVVTIERPTQVLVTLRQLRSSRGEKTPLKSISFHVFQVRNIAQSFPEMPSYGAVIDCEKAAERQVCSPGLLEEADSKYVVVPLIHELSSHEQVSFELEIKCANPLANPKIALVPSLHTKLARGFWDESTSGGSAAYPSWRQNPQYHLKVHRSTDLHMFLTQHTKIPEHLGCYIVRADDSRHIMRLSQSRLMNNDLKFRKKVEISSGKLQLIPGSYIVIPATYEPGKIMAFTISFLAAVADSFDVEKVEAPFCKSFSGSWGDNSSGGSFNHSGWIRNPKYAFTIHKPTALTFVLGIPPASREQLLQQQQQQQPQSHVHRTPRGGNPALAPEDIFIGFYLFKGNIANAARLTRKELVGRTKHFTDAREVVETIRLDPGAYILLPCTYQPNIHANFLVQIHADHEPESVQFIEEAIVQVEGEWKGPTAGGSFAYPSWRLNPQYLLTSSTTASAVISLEQPSKASVEELPFISVAIIRPNSANSVYAASSSSASSSKPSSLTITSRIFNMAPTEVVHLIQFSNVMRCASIPISISPEQPLILLPMTMQSGIETSFKIAVNHAAAKLERLADTFTAKVVEGVWSKANSTAGGCMNNRDTWLQNPKYRFATKKPGLLRFVMHQQHLTPPQSGQTAAPLPPGGFYIFRSPTGQTGFTKNDFVGKTEFASTKEVKADFELEVGIYCIILTKFEPGVEGKVSLHMFAPHPEIAIGTMK